MHMNTRIVNKKYINAGNLQQSHMEVRPEPQVKETRGVSMYPD